MHRCKSAAIQAWPYSLVEAAIGTGELWHISTQEKLAFADLVPAGCCADAAAAVRVTARMNAKTPGRPGVLMQRSMVAMCSPGGVRHGRQPGVSLHANAAAPCPAP
ncbi:hypothetical protein XAB3213_540008 [Xanthomonas citri pv. bilvae]|nr:hypothetical protein XAB3213_540008 [Xanthomonas citri pv. bilvae]